MESMLEKMFQMPEEQQRKLFENYAQLFRDSLARQEVEMYQSFRSQKERKVFMGISDIIIKGEDLELDKITSDCIEKTSFNVFINGTPLVVTINEKYLNGFMAAVYYVDEGMVDLIKMIHLNYGTIEQISAKIYDAISEKFYSRTITLRVVVKELARMSELGFSLEPEDIDDILLPLVKITKGS